MAPPGPPIDPGAPGPVVRDERSEDLPAIRRVTLAAFGTAEEADLIERLRRDAHPLLSLVGESAGEVVGHILFSPVTILEHPGIQAMGLAPMSVLPGRQRQGIGSALVRAGLERCRAIGAEVVVVLGHPAYYPRFGFVPASRFGLRSEYDVPDDVFLALRWCAGVAAPLAGTVRYHAAFAGP